MTCPVYATVYVYTGQVIFYNELVLHKTFPESASRESMLKSGYSVMQSDGNSLCGDVVLESFNMVYSDEDSI